MRSTPAQSAPASPGPFALEPAGAGPARRRLARVARRKPSAQPAVHRAELERLFVEERGRLLFVAMRILQHPQEAEDAVQDGLLSALKALDGFRGTCLLSTWLHRVVVNAALMRLRSRKRRRECGLGDLADHAAPPGRAAGFAAPAPAAAGLEDHIDAQRAAAAALDLIARQAAGRRQVLEMRLVDGLSNPETAALLGITLGAVKLRLCRGRARLRTSLARRLRRDPGAMI